MPTECADDCAGCPECCCNATITDEWDAKYCGPSGLGCSYCSRPNHYAVTHGPRTSFVAESATTERNRANAPILGLYAA